MQNVDTGTVALAQTIRVQKRSVMWKTTTENRQHGTKPSAKKYSNESHKFVRCFVAS